MGKAKRAHRDARSIVDGHKRALPTLASLVSLAPRNDDSVAIMLSRIGTAARIFFTFFVDRIFTTRVERPFTNVFGVIVVYNFASCLCLLCNVD